MLPVAYALLAEMMPPRHRSWSLVFVGGIGGVGGYLAASSLSGWLQPVYGWRIMWLLNLPTGLLLVLLSGTIPESVKFLLQVGRTDAARAAVARYGASLAPRDVDIHVAPPVQTGKSELGVGLALTIGGLTWGLVNFGLLLWVPTELAGRGLGAGAIGRLLSSSALIALPTVAVGALVYSRWSTRGAVVLALVTTLLGLAGVLLLEAGRISSAVAPIALLIVGSNALLAVLLPYTAETYPARVRGRATGWVAACTKAGGLVAQALGILASVPALGVAAAVIMIPAAFAALLVMAFGPETRGRELSDMGH